MLRCWARVLVVPATSQATLVFTRNPLNPAVFVAKDDGSAARKLAWGRIRGSRRTGRRSSSTARQRQPACGTDGRRRRAVGRRRSLPRGWQDPFVFAWSPDSTTIAVLLGPEVGKQRLTTIDVATGAQRRRSPAASSRASASAPEGSEQLVYAKAASENFPPRSDVYRIDLLPPGAVSVAAPTAAAADQRPSLAPARSGGRATASSSSSTSAKRAASTAPRTSSS